ncbi:MAG: RNA 2'-phosphotransferase [Kouleothrix sp.]
MDAQLIRFSKFISLVLRHQPQHYGLTLDAQGWATIDDLLAAANRAGVPLTHALLQQVVAQNDKQRFAISADGRAIRANQGHSIAIDLALTPREPPPLLYHGTASRFVASIRTQGLLRRSRQHVHLSPDITTATKVGLRHGSPVVLTVASGAMHRDGYQFYCSENGVWLVAAVPVAYLAFPEQ